MLFKHGIAKGSIVDNKQNLLDNYRSIELLKITNSKPANVPAIKKCITSNIGYRHFL